MLGLYNKTFQIPGFSISDQNLTKLACEIAMRSENGDQILNDELLRISSPDRKKRLTFIMPALSASQQERDAFFKSLKYPENRNPEPWVLDALNYLHHHLHGNTSLKYVAESLDMLEEIQRTGDIFFPKNWLDATLGNYQSAEAVEIVDQYLSSRP
jgi:aminopeptidase N